MRVPTADEIVSTDPWGFGAQSGYYTDRETGFVLCTFRHHDPSATNLREKTLPTSGEGREIGARAWYNFRGCAAGDIPLRAAPGSSNGRTAEFGSVYRGSSPCPGI